jgi:hypothetical protein
MNSRKILYSDLFLYVQKKVNFRQTKKGTKFNCNKTFRYIKEFCDKKNIDFNGVERRLNQESMYCDCDFLYTSMNSMLESYEVLPVG